MQCLHGFPAGSNTRKLCLGESPTKSPRYSYSPTLTGWAMAIITQIQQLGKMMCKKFPYMGAKFVPQKDMKLHTTDWADNKSTRDNVLKSWRRLISTLLQQKCNLMENPVCCGLTLKWKGKAVKNLPQRRQPFLPLWKSSFPLPKVSHSAVAAAPTWLKLCLPVFCRVRMAFWVG